MTKAKLQTITVHELKKRLDQTPNLCIIDVRENDEWHECHIPGALHLPKGILKSNITANVPEKDCPIYLHCRGGVRSVYAGNCLLELGYSEVYSIEGGIMEWAKAGYPIRQS